MSGLTSPLHVLESIVVDAVLLTVWAPITFSYVLDASDSSSANIILYIVTLQVPAVPFSPLNLTLLPLMSAVKVARFVLEVLVEWVLYSVIKASVPLWTTNTSTFWISFVVVLFTEIKYFAPL